MRRLLALALVLVATRARAVETVMVPAPDGTLLATDIYRKDDLPRPVQVIRGGGARTGSKALGESAESAGIYDLVVQDLRGGVDPQGTDFIFSQDGGDGRSLLAFIEKQAWSSGHVSMFGVSNSGIVDYLAARGAVPSLRGISPSYATGDLLHYGLFNGGVLHLETANDVAFGGVSWEAHASLSMWEDYLIDDAQAAAVDAIGLHRGGWFDVFGQGTLDSFSRIMEAGGPNAKGRQKVVIGPWTHGGGASATVGQLTFRSSTVADSPLPALSQAWQKGAFTGDWTSWDALGKVSVYVMGDASNPAAPGNAWQTYDEWPPPATELPLYFASDRSLAGTPGGSASLQFTSDPSNPCPTLGGTNNLLSCLPDAGTCGPYDQRTIETRKDVLVFTSEPLPSAGTMVGRIHADVWISTDLPDVDVFVRLTDVYPDGRSMLMAQGIQRARYRNGTCPELLVAGQPALVPVDLSSTALALNTGHRLRVIVSASASPLYAINPQNGDDYVGAKPSRSGTINVLVGGTTASAIVVPVAGSGTPPDRRPSTQACDAGVGDASAGDAGTTGETGEAGASVAPGADGPSEAAAGGTSPSADAGSGCACSVGVRRHDEAWLLLLLTAASRFLRRRQSPA
jgi:predicted acyl esterase